MVLAARQEPFAAAIGAAQQEPFAAMVIAYLTVLSTAAMVIPAQQEPFAAPTNRHAALWGQPAQGMDTANKIFSCCQAGL